MSDSATISSVERPFELAQPNDYPQGWYADVAAHLSPKFAIVGEAGGTYHSDDMSRTSGSLSIQEASDIRFHTFMGGVRVRAPQHPAFVPFGQVLVGGEHDTSMVERTLQFSQTLSTSRREGSSSNPVLALDGSVTMTARVIGVRASAGYVRFFGTADADTFRLSLGACFRF